MELRQLRYFIAVAEELHFGRAAQRLHMSQPPLSVQVSRLEEEIGTPLFERNTRHVTLTPAGVHLHERAISLLANLDQIRDEMSEFATGYAGEITAGFVSSANYTVLPGVVQLFRARREQVSLKLIPLTSGEQLARLRDGSLDVGILRDEFPEDDDFTAEVVYEERLVACLPLGHPFAEQEEVSAEELATMPIISYPRSLMPGYVDRVAQAVGALDVVEEVVHQETALGFVAAGVGASILPESVRQLAPASIAVVPIAGDATTRLLAAYPTRAGGAAVREVFVECIREVAAGL
ncbi:LysR family transcriptional regulator [Microbacterium sorbitolivorans]|uniref:LysR family transcriptional regulator n=1 Tax=Microbacterium sorbitolivorans TaxID=1867410 RepID=A0A367Y0Z8_9MICO|nr:LysR substrate-binding domain-containing protein [Microbacterium sorbitolivorans]RCK58701.1 LysR family transcriptional regulator [Microbacterium sorbitolivorans]